LAGGEAYPIHYAATALLTQAVFDDPDVRVPAAILRSLALTRQTHTLWDEPQPGTALVLTEWSRCPVPPELWPPVHFVGFLIRLAPSNRVRKALAALNELVVEAAYGGLRAGGGGGEAPAAPISLWDDARGLPVRLYADIVIKFGGAEQEEEEEKEEGIPAHRAVVAQISEFCAALVAPQWTSSSSSSSSSSVYPAGQPDCIATVTPRNVWVGCLQFAYTGTITSADRGSTARLAALAEFATFIGFAALQRACTHLLGHIELAAR
jgi:hypothetical protein